MVVRSVVRRSRLKELGVGRATFRAAGEPVPVGATVQIPRDKKIKASITIENTGSGAVSGDFSAEVFYADSLSDSSGDPKTDENTWWSEMENVETITAFSITLNPGDTFTLESYNPVNASTWSEGTIIDAGVVLMVYFDTTPTYLDSLKIADAVKIIAPTLRVEITDVTFSEA